MKDASSKRVQKAGRTPMKTQAHDNSTAGKFTATQDQYEDAKGSDGDDEDEEANMKDEMKEDNEVEEVEEVELLA